MAPVQKQADDFVIINRSNAASGGGWVDNFAVTGPRLDSIGLQFPTLDEAKAKGRELARIVGVSVWCEEKSETGSVVLVESYRPN